MPMVYNIGYATETSSSLGKFGAWSRSTPSCFQFLAFERGRLRAVGGYHHHHPI